MAIRRNGSFLVFLLMLTAWVAPIRAENVESAENVKIFRETDGGFTIVARKAPLSEVYEMLSRKEEMSIVLGDSVDSEVSVSLFNVDLDHAVRRIAEAAGYGVENQNGTYMIVAQDDVGEVHASGSTDLRAFKIQYSDPEKVREILEKHLSRYGEITALEERGMLVVEDLPEFLDRIDRLLEEIDRAPTQILLEAKLLEIKLSSNEVLGIDWTKISKWDGNKLSFGVRGLSTGASAGLFFDIITDNFEGALEALSEQGRVRALATPRLLTLENQEAEILVGDRLGYRVTTTINQVTTESVEFIDSGVILRFKPSVDRMGRVLLEIHPEVSNGVIIDGVPSVSTTEATTQLLAEDGQMIFIGGLIREQATEGRRGVPFLSRIPIVGLLFARNEWQKFSTETVVILKASVVKPGGARMVELDREQIRDFEEPLERARAAMADDLDVPWSPNVGDREQHILDGPVYSGAPPAQIDAPPPAPRTP